MSSILTQAVRAIANNYADAIEGGNTYRGSGTAYNGVPGTDSFDPIVADIGTITTDGSGTTSTISWNNADDYDSEHFVSPAAATPPYFAVCATATNSDNAYTARRITTWGSSSLTVSPVFPAATSSGDTFTIAQGFKRVPDNFDFEDEAASAPLAWDRFFDISVLSGHRLPWYGNGVERYETRIDLRLQLNKRSRARLVKDTAFETMLRFRNILTKSAHRGSYVELLDSEQNDPEFKVDDQDRVVILDKYRLVYRVASTFR